MDKNEYVLILQTNNHGDVAIIKSVLEAAGVNYHFQNEHFGTLVPLLEPARLLVPKNQMAKTRKLLAGAKIENKPFDLSRKDDVRGTVNANSFLEALKENGLALNCIIAIQFLAVMIDIYIESISAQSINMRSILSIVFSGIIAFGLLTRMNMIRLLARISYFVLVAVFPFMVLAYIEKNAVPSPVFTVILLLIFWGYFLWAFLFLGKKRIRRLFD